jgi:hypothetical protein
MVLATAMALTEAQEQVRAVVGVEHFLRVAAAVAAVMVVEKTGQHYKVAVAVIKLVG